MGRRTDPAAGNSLAVRRPPLFFGLGILLVSLLFVFYQVGRTGDTLEPPEAVSKPVSVTDASVVMKGSGSFLSIEIKETEEPLLWVQDELGSRKRYKVPKGLTLEREEEEIQPEALQKGDILDIDYTLSASGERIVTHLSVTIPATEKEVQVEAPALGSSTEELPGGQE